MYTRYNNNIINPRHMRRRVTVVVLCVCLSVTKLTATYLVCESKVLDYKVPYDVPKAWFMWISPKTLCLPPSLLSPLVSFWRSWDGSARGFFLTLRVCRLSCQLPCAFLWYPLTFWLVCILSWRCSAWTQLGKWVAIILDMKYYCSVYFSLALRFCIRVPLRCFEEASLVSRNLR